MQYYAIGKSPEVVQAINSSDYHAYFYIGPQQIIFSQHTYDYIFQHSIKKERKLQQVLMQAYLKIATREELQGSDGRIVYPMASYLQDPPPANVLEELTLLTFAQSQFSFEYVGRGKKHEVHHSDEEILTIDILGGNRKYQWRTRPANFRSSERSLAHAFAGLRQWFDDPEARIVLSLGSGGLRVLGSTAALKILDLMRVRNRISEIWGSSSGALIAYLYSVGVSPHWIEKIGYNVYNDHLEAKAKKMPLWSAIPKRLGQIVKNLSTLGFAGIADVHQAFFEAIHNSEYRKNDRVATIPCYVVATNPDKRIPFVLADPADMMINYGESFLACDPEVAVQASTAIPFVFAKQNLRRGSDEIHALLDGSFAEEVPLLLPYRKWRKDQRALPSQTKKRLKIFCIDSGMRLREFPWMRKQASSLQVFKNLQHVGELIDLVFDNRNTNLVASLNDIQNVEVLSLKLELGDFAAADIYKLPMIIQQSRICFLEQIQSISRELSVRYRSDYLSHEASSSQDSLISSHSSEQMLVDEKLVPDDIPFSEHGF